MKPDPILRGVLFGLLFFGFAMGVDYVRQVIIAKGTFSPMWITNIGLSVITGAAMIIGPNAAQRKQNRQDLKDRFTGKH